MSNNEDCPEPLETNMNKSSKFLLWSRKPQQTIYGIDNPIWKQKAYKIIYLVARFISIITKHILRNDLIHLTKSDFNLIHDSSSDYNFFKYKGYFPKDKPKFLLIKLNYWFSCILQRESQFIQQNHKKWLLKPDDTIMISWNIYLILIVTINVFYVSLRISFNEISQLNIQNKDFIFEQLPVYSFIFEIFLKFNTCIYYKGNLITNRIKIIKNYCSNDLIIDLFLVGPFFIGQLIDFRFFDFVIVLKVFQLSSLFSSLFNRLELSPRQTALFDLFKLISFMILVAHFSACIWHIIGQWGEWGNGQDKTWLKVANLQHESWLDRYVVSFYWSIVTMTTIGYGDITPVNLTERIFVIFMTMISSATFAYTVNNIGGIFQDFSKQSVQLKNNMNQLNRFLRSQNVSIDLQIKFRRYFEYLWSKPSQKVSQFSELIPKSLKDQMIVDVNLKILNQIHFFKNFSQQFLHKLCMHLEEKHLQSEDYLFTRNKNSQFLYILVTGEIKLIVSLKNKQRVLQKINTPQFIGQFDYFTNQSYSFDAIASKTTKILLISRENLFLVFKEFPSDYEVYQQLKDDVIENQKFQQISVQCNTCQSHQHFINQCPYLFGIPSKLKTLYNYRKSLPIDRISNYKRINHQRKMYALKHHFIVMESVINYMMKNDDAVHIEGIKELQQYGQQISQNQFPFSSLPIGINVQQSNNPSMNFQQKQQQQLSSQRFFNSGVLLPPSEDSPRTCRLMQNPETQIRNDNRRQLLRKLSLNFTNQAEEQNIEEEVPINEKVSKRVFHLNESLCVIAEQQQQQQQQQPQKQFIDQLQIPQLQITQINGRRKSFRQKQDDDSGEDSEEEQKIMGQYIDIFQQFEKYKEYSNYHPQNNITIVITKYQEKKVVFLRQTKKRKSRRQETLLHLLKQAQCKQRQ